MNENLISIQENFKNWGGGEQRFFFWLPEIFAGYQLFLNSWSPGHESTVFEQFIQGVDSVYKPIHFMFSSTSSKNV